MGGWLVCIGMSRSVFRSPRVSAVMHAGSAVCPLSLPSQYWEKKKYRREEKEEEKDEKKKNEEEIQKNEENEPKTTWTTKNTWTPQRGIGLVWSRLVWSGPF